MGAAKKLLTLLFLVTLSASAFGTWTELKSSTQDLLAIDGVVTTGLATLCVSGKSGTVLTSTDYGANWSTRTAPSGNPDLDFVAFAGGRLFVAGSTPTAAACFYSTDGGSSWTDISPSIKSTFAMDFGSASNGVIAGLTIAVANAVLYTNDGGTSWHTSTPTSEFFSAAHFLDANTVWIVGGNGNIWKSTDGGQNWSQQGTGETAASLSDIQFIDANNGFAGGSSSTFLTTSNGGATWDLRTVSGLPAVDISSLYFLDASTGWITAWEDTSKTGRVYKLTKSGSAWSAALEYTTAANSSLYDIYLTDAHNGWILEYIPDSSGKIYGQITAIAVSAIVQKDRPTQTRAPVGFTGDLTVTGTNFQAGSWGAGNVTFSGSEVAVNSVTRVSATELTVNVTISSGAATGSRTVTVFNIDGSSHSGSFTVSDLPTVTSADPSSVDQGTSGQTVVLYGSGFQSGLATSDISFGSGITVSSVTVDSAYQITAVIAVAAGATTGSRDISITNPDSGSKTSAGILNVSSSTAVNPTITSVYPDSVEQGAASQTLVITGAGFKAASNVSFPTNGITINSTDRSRIPDRLDINITVSGTSPIGARTLMVTNTDDGGTGNLNEALYVTAAGAVDPAVTSVLPSHGYQGWANKDVYIYGSNFQSGALIAFDPATGIVINDITHVSASGIRVNIDIDTTASTGFRNVKIVNPDGGHVLSTNKLEVRAPSSTTTVTNDRGLAYPNPVNLDKTGSVNVQFELTRDDVVEVKAFDSNQRQLLKNPPTINATAGNNTIIIRRSDFWEPPGNQLVLLPIISKTENKVVAKAKVMIINY